MTAPPVPRFLTSAEKIGLRFDGRQRDAAQARNVRYWPTVALKHGEPAAARLLALEFWWLDPRFALTNSDALQCTAACLVSLMARRIPDALRHTHALLRSRRAIAGSWR